MEVVELSFWILSDDLAKFPPSLFDKENALRTVKLKLKQKNLKSRVLCKAVY